MENPFESGHVKNYILLYASVVVIVILFFIASSLFHEVETVETKVFNTEVQEKKVSEVVTEMNASSKFKLMDKAY